MAKISIRSILDRVERLESELAAARQRIKQLEAQIETDPLLDVLNRRGFERELNRALAHVKRYQVSAGLIFIDLNNFKMINDQHGHLAGDAILRSVAAAIGAHTRKSDVIGRFGGDEFIALLWNASRVDVRTKATLLEQMISSLEIPFTKKILCVGASAGMTMLRSNDTVSVALERADADMYSRKYSDLRKPSAPESRPSEAVSAA
jgi:diguanylate cyclase (GGDEF)-like protein